MKSVLDGSRRHQVLTSWWSRQSGPGLGVEVDQRNLQEPSAVGLVDGVDSQHPNAVDAESVE